jgi:hypothetical protein
MKTIFFISLVLFANISSAQSNFPLLLPAQQSNSREKPTALLVQNDGSIIVAGIRNYNASLIGSGGVPGGMLVAKYNKNGTNTWVNFSPISSSISNYVNVYGITQKPNGNYLIVGDSAISGGITLSDAYILVSEINSTGNRIWTKSYQIPPNEFGYDMYLADCKDSSFIAIGYGYRKMKFDYNGNLLLEISDANFCFGVTPLANGNLVFINGFSPFHITKTNSLFASTWNKTINFTPTSIIENKTNNNLFISGYSANSTTNRIGINACYNASGIKQWQDSIAIESKTQTNNLTLNNNDLFVCGETSTCLNIDTPNYCYGISKAFISKIDATNGQVLQSKIYADSVYKTGTTIDSGANLQGKYIGFTSGTIDSIYLVAYQYLFKTLPFSSHVFFYTSSTEENIKVYKFNTNLQSWPLAIHTILKPNISIYPNPASNILNFPTPISAYKIISIDGKIIKNASGNFQNIDISDLQNGFYLLQLTQNEKQFNSRFTKE